MGHGASSLIRGGGGTKNGLALSMLTKPLLCLMLLVLPAFTSFAVAPEDAPAMAAKMKVLDKRVADDLSAGVLASDEGDNFTERINHVRNAIATAQTLDGPTRQLFRD